MLVMLVLCSIIFYLAIRIFIGRKSDSVACLVGKTAIVTGGNAGLGYATSLLLASRGCKVIIVDRDDATVTIKEIIEKTGNPNVFYKNLDLCSLKKIREFVIDFKKIEEKIDILINNAGVGAASKLTTEDDLNTVMQINFFGAFLLTHLLIGHMKKHSRIVFLSSISSFINDLTVENLNSKKRSEALTSYANSKLCNILAAQEFGRKLKKFDITAYSVDPGAVRSKIFTKTHRVTHDWYFKLSTSLILFIFGQEIMDGAQTVFHVATHEKLQNESGRHYAYLRRWFVPWKLNDEKFREKIWERSEELVGLESHEKL